MTITHPDTAIIKGEKPADHGVVLRYAYLKVAAIISLILLIGLATVGDYGIASDERTEMQSVFWNLDLIRAGEPLPNFQAYYGNVFHFAAEAFFQTKSILQTGAISQQFDGDDSNSGANRLAFRERIESKHLFTFLFSLLALMAVAGIVAIMAGPEHAWLGPLLLALMPRFWGNSFFNPKDLPFAAMFTVGTFAGAWLVGNYLQIRSSVSRPGINRLSVYSLLFGVLLGLVTGTRIAGCFLLAFVFAAHVAAHVLKGGSPWGFLRFWAFYGLQLAGWAVTVVLVHPASWSNRVGWFLESLRFMSRFQWDGANLFNGYYASAANVPLSYIPVWLAITTPAVLQLLFAGGLIGLLVKFRRLTGLQVTCALLVLLQIGLLATVAIVRSSTIYDGIRQFLFILPGMAAIAAAALAWVLQGLRPGVHRLAALGLFALLTLPVVIDMVSLHPYEYVYFNRLFGGLQQAQGRFDTDYWGLSMREAMEWVNSDGGPDARVVSSRPLPSSETYALLTIDVIPLPEFDPQVTSRPFYYIALPRYDLQQQFPECPVVYRVLRQGVPLTIVKQCH